METKIQMQSRLEAERRKISDFEAIRQERREELLLHIRSTILCLEREYRRVEEDGFFASADVQTSVDWLMEKSEAVNDADEAIDYANHQIEDMLADLADEELWLGVSA